jgi:hypothetical protein
MPEPKILPQERSERCLVDPDVGRVGGLFVGRSALAGVPPFLRTSRQFAVLAGVPPFLRTSRHGHETAHFNFVGFRDHREIYRYGLVFLRDLRGRHHARSVAQLPRFRR